MENKDLKQCICEMMDNIVDRKVLDAIYSFITHYTNSKCD